MYYSLILSVILAVLVVYNSFYVCDPGRYKMLCKKTWPNWKGRPKDGIREILKVCATIIIDYRHLQPQSDYP